MSVDETEEPEDIEIQTMDALEWLLMRDNTLSATAIGYGVPADLSDDELEAWAWMAERVAYDEGVSIDGDDLLSILRAGRQAARRSSTTLTLDDHPPSLDVV